MLSAGGCEKMDCLIGCDPEGMNRNIGKVVAGVDAT